jgi:8-oxo-dGTP diphosphatase
MRVVAAVLRDGGKILLARKKPGSRFGGLWEFPGGKLAEGETPVDGLKRELREELGIEAEVGGVVTTSIHKFDQTTLELTALDARWISGEYTLTDHDLLAWVAPSELLQYAMAMAPADIPIARHLAGA